MLNLQPLAPYSSMTCIVCSECLHADLYCFEIGLAIVCLVVNTFGCVGLLLPVQNLDLPRGFRLTFPVMVSLETYRAYLGCINFTALGTDLGFEMLTKAAQGKSFQSSPCVVVRTWSLATAGLSFASSVCTVQYTVCNAR